MLHRDNRSQPPERYIPQFFIILTKTASGCRLDGSLLCALQKRHKLFHENISIHCWGTSAEADSNHLQRSPFSILKRSTDRLSGDSMNNRQCDTLRSIPPKSIGNNSFWRIALQLACGNLPESCSALLPALQSAAIPGILEQSPETQESKNPLFLQGATAPDDSGPNKAWAYVDSKAPTFLAGKPHRTNQAQ
jgi:hypothetical protein